MIMIMIMINNGIFLNYKTNSPVLLKAGKIVKLTNKWNEKRKWWLWWWRRPEWDQDTRWNLRKQLITIMIMMCMINDDDDDDDNDEDDEITI